MMKKSIGLLIACLLSIGAISQSCLPTGISFTSQSEIDNFKANYPDCTEIEGYLEIDGSGITNLDSLHQITSIGGYLDIYSIPDLVSIEGLGALTSIGTGRLGIHGTALTNLHGLENLITIPGLRIDGNPMLSSLEGLNNLTSSPGGVYILENPLLESLQGLESLVDVGEGGLLYITENETLNSLDGIDNIVFNPFYVTEIWITNNPLLSECEVESICKLLNDNGIINVSGNATGCNTIDEVRSECGTSVGELTSNDAFSIYPNPALSHIIIEHNSYINKEYKLLLADLTGQEILKTNIAKQKTVIDIDNIPSGIYFVKIWNDKDVMVRKVIKQ